MTTTREKVIEKMKKSFMKLENSDNDSASVSSEHQEEILPVILTYLTPAMVEEAKTQLNETEETREKGLAELKKLIEAETKLVALMDEWFLLAFLRARKFNAKKAFKLMQNYFSIRKEYKHVIDITQPKNVMDTILRGYIGLLQHRDKNGCTVFIAKVAQWDPQIDTFDDMFRAISGILVYTLEHPATQVAGFRMICDLRGISWKQWRFFTPKNLLLVVRSTQFCFPARYKGIHALCDNKMVSILWNLIYPFLTSKLKKRIFMHGEDLSSLQDYIDPSVLPQEFGGQAPSFENSKWENLMKEQTDFMLDLIRYGYKN